LGFACSCFFRSLKHLIDLRSFCLFNIWL
jgi:hypothetical protein